ncbi:hypothetical protein G6F37_001177 [Rhizopus arrhizus]|nr:hypothetical protein G6F38_006243 [Rhizopus arrhizus]KAG1163473.1 hypothetical protein G6F37_001177 [Rhizopus arrhizus]
MLYSQLIHLGDSETESSDETSDLCYSSIRPLDSDNSNNISNIYETLDSYNKAYLTYLQPLSTADQFMIHPYQSSLFKSPLISDVQLGFDHDSALQQTVMDQQKESYSWLYHDPVDAFIANQQPELTSTYVSLSDVNSHVAKIDSLKYSTAFPYDEPPADFCQQAFLTHPSFPDSEDEEDMFSDNSSEGDEWPFHHTIDVADPSSRDKKLMIKIKKPVSLDSFSTEVYRDWSDTAQNLPPAAPFSAYRKYQKSVPNLSAIKKTRTKSRASSLKSTMASSSSLSSLSSNLKKSMKVSDSLASFLTQDEDLFEENEETEDEEEEEELGLKKKTARSVSQLKKGKNVDKACNHCKRSHLRCDEMRPCRRCITTGKMGCRDVQHKPRGRPKLLKNQ